MHITEKGRIAKDVINQNPGKTQTELAYIIFEKNKKLFKSMEAARSLLRKHMNKNPETKDVKTGLESKGDHVVINWSTKTVITDLGEYGNIVCSFDMHKAIQKSYVWSGEGETAAIVAMKFDFPHAKAIHKYAKLHGFTKSSLPQTDIEFESGLTVEDAVKENIQTLKRDTYKKTEVAKWKFIQDNSDKWLNFHHNVLKPLENHIAEHLPKFKPERLRLSSKKNNKNFALVSGISDIHYMKLCYDARGNTIYDRKIALKRVAEHTKVIIDKTLSYGVPEKIFIPVANDNIHVDGFEHTTTKGTSQVGQTDGIWKIELGNYLDMTMAMVETYAKIAPVELVILFGNHDKQTSHLLQVALERIYRGRKDITVHVRYLARTYLKYYNTGLLFTHSDEMKPAKMQQQSHQLIMGEARQQDININEIKQWFLFAGDLHADAYKDLGGFVKYYVMPSLTPCDEWHFNSGYSGKSEESAGYIVSREGVMEAIYYAKS